MWAHLASALLGLWLMAAPAVLGYAGAAADADHVVGPLVASFGLIAAWSVMRPLRWLNFAFGAWLLVAPLVLVRPVAGIVSSLATGILLLALSPVRGRSKHGFGGGWSSLGRAGARHRGAETG